MTIAIEGDLPAGMVSDQYDAKLTAAGGNFPYQWATVEDTVLPSGLQLDQDGKISGVPELVAEGTTHLTVQITDATGATARRDFSLTINPALKISRSIDLPSGVERPRFLAQLHAVGGALPHMWALARGSRLLAGLSLGRDTGQISGTPTSTGTTRFTVQAADGKGHSDTADFSIKVSSASLWRHPVGRLRDRAVGRTKITSLSVKVSPGGWPRPSKRLSHVSTWLAFLAFWMPVFGNIWILIYAFATPGPHFTYLAVGILTSLAAFLSGCLAGFLFGVPRVVSSG